MFIRGNCSAMKWKWKFPKGSGYEETEQNIVNVGLNFANDNLAQLASAPQNYCWTGMINRFVSNTENVRKCVGEAESFAHL